MCEYCGPGTWLQSICTGGLVKTTPVGHQGWLMVFPALRRGQGQHQQQFPLWAHTVGERWHNRAHSLVNCSSGRRGKLSGSSPSGSAPILTILHCSSEMQVRKGSGGFYSQQLGSRPCPKQGCSNHRAKRRPTQYPVQALVTTTSVTPPIKGIMASIHWGKRQQASILKRALVPKNIKPMQATQGCSHIKIALQDQSR